jgi:hypothetical protein
MNLPPLSGWFEEGALWFDKGFKAGPVPGRDP